MSWIICITEYRFFCTQAETDKDENVSAENYYGNGDYQYQLKM